MINLEPLTSSELSRKFQVDPSTLVPTVNGLEKRGLIYRTRDTNDRRRQPFPGEAERRAPGEGSRAQAALRVVLRRIRRTRPVSRRHE